MRVVVSGVAVLTAALCLTGVAGAQPRDLGKPVVLLTASWGQGPGQLGRKDGSEGSSLGPMSFTVAPDGSLYVLDQVNGRVAVFRPRGLENKEAPQEAAYTFDRFISVPGTTFEEIEVGADGRLLLLDRLVREALVVLDPVTRDTEELSVLGAGIPEGGGVMAVLVRKDGVWLDYGREHSVRVLDSSWNPCERKIVPGRPLRGEDGTLEASLGVRGGADVRYEGTGDGPRSLFVLDDMPVGRLIDVTDGPGGLLLVVYHCWRWAEDGDSLSFQEVRGRWYDKNGQILATLSSPHTITPIEQFREIRVLQDGSVVQMAFTPEGVRLLQWGGP